MSRKATWQMTDVQLAKAFADHFGWRGNSGGWITDQHNRLICQGWARLADTLKLRKWIAPGVGIGWRRAGENPTLARRSASRAY